MISRIWRKNLWYQSTHFQPTTLCVLSVAPLHDPSAPPLLLLHTPAFPVAHSLHSYRPLHLPHAFRMTLHQSKVPITPCSHHLLILLPTHLPSMSGTTRNSPTHCPTRLGLRLTLFRLLIKRVCFLPCIPPTLLHLRRPHLLCLRPPLQICWNSLSLSMTSRAYNCLLVVPPPPILMINFRISRRTNRISHPLRISNRIFIPYIRLPLAWSLFWPPSLSCPLLHVNAWFAAPNYQPRTLDLMPTRVASVLADGVNSAIGSAIV